MLNFMNYLKPGNNLRVKASNRLNEDIRLTNNIQSFLPCLSRFQDELSDLGALIERSSVKNQKDAFSIMIELEESIRKLRSVINDIQEYERTADFQPKNLEELKEIIKDTIKEKGLNCDLNFIDTSKITSMEHLFHLNAFNGDISKWDTSNVENMEFMFAGSKFDGDISEWDVSKVKNMEYMFANSKFNGDISEWDVSNVRDMKYMFDNSRFNSDISKWDVSKVEDMSFMFQESGFKGDIGRWNVSNVKWMDYMFNGSGFSKDISKWKTTSIKSVIGIFTKCPLENKPAFQPKFFE